MFKLLIMMTYCSKLWEVYMLWYFTMISITRLLVVIGCDKIYGIIYNYKMMHVSSKQIPSHSQISANFTHHSPTFHQVLTKAQIFTDFSEIIRFFDQRLKAILYEHKAIHALSTKQSETSNLQNIAQEQKYKTIEHESPSLSKTSLNSISRTLTNNQIAKESSEQIQAIYKLGENYYEKYNGFEKESPLYQHNKNLIKRFLYRIKEKIQQCYEHLRHHLKFKQYFEAIVQEIRQIQREEKDLSKLIGLLLCGVELKTKKLSQNNLWESAQTAAKKDLFNKNGKDIESKPHDSEDVKNEDKLKNMASTNGFRKTLHKMVKKEGQSMIRHSIGDAEKLRIKPTIFTNPQNKKRVLSNSCSDLGNRLYDCLGLDDTEFNRRKILGIEDRERTTTILKDDCMQRNRMIISMINRYSKQYQKYSMNRKVKQSKKKNKSVSSIYHESQPKLIKSEKNLHIDQKYSQFMKIPESTVNHLHISEGKAKGKVMLIEWQEEIQTSNKSAVTQYSEQKDIQNIITLKKDLIKYPSINNKHASYASLINHDIIEEQEDKEEQIHRNYRDHSNSNYQSGKLGQLRIKKKQGYASAMGPIHILEKKQKKQEIQNMLRSKSQHTNNQEANNSKSILNKFMAKMYSNNVNTENKKNVVLKLTNIDVCQGNQRSQQSNNSYNNSYGSYNRAKLEHGNFMKKKNLIKFRNDMVIKKCKLEMKTEIAQIQKQQSINPHKFFRSPSPLIRGDEQVRETHNKKHFQGIFINGIKHLDSSSPFTKINN